MKHALTLSSSRPAATRLGLVVLGLVALSGCGSLTPMEQRMLTGAAIGTTVGAVGTVMMGGCVACGAAIGGVVGTGAGYVVDQVQD